MEVTPQQLILQIGEQAVEIGLLRRRVVQLEQALTEAQAPNPNGVTSDHGALTAPKVTAKER